MNPTVVTDPLTQKGVHEGIILPPIPGITTRIFNRVMQGYADLGTRTLRSAPHLAQVFTPVVHATRIEEIAAHLNIPICGLVRLLPFARREIESELRKTPAIEPHVFSRKKVAFLESLANLKVCDVELLAREGLWSPEVLCTLFVSATINSKGSDPLHLAIKGLYALIRTAVSDHAKGEVAKLVHMTNERYSERSVQEVLTLAGEIHALRTVIRHFSPYEFSPPTKGHEHALFVDLGSGCNFMTCMAGLNRGTPYLCVDPHPLPISTIRTTADLLDLSHISVRQQRAEDLILPPQSVGTLRVTQMQNYIQDYVNEILRLSTAVKNGGSIIIASLASNASKGERLLCSLPLMLALIERGWEVDAHVHKHPKHTDEDRIIFIKNNLPYIHHKKQLMKLLQIFNLLQIQFN